MAGGSVVRFNEATLLMPVFQQKCQLERLRHRVGTRVDEQETGGVTQYHTTVCWFIKQAVVQISKGGKQYQRNLRKIMCLNHSGIRFCLYLEHSLIQVMWGITLISNNSVSLPQKETLVSVQMENVRKCQERTEVVHKGETTLGVLFSRSHYPQRTGQDRKCWDITHALTTAAEGYFCTHTALWMGNVFMQ